MDVSFDANGVFKSFAILEPTTRQEIEAFIKENEIDDKAFEKE